MSKAKGWFIFGALCLVLAGFPWLATFTPHESGCVRPSEIALPAEKGLVSLHIGEVIRFAVIQPTGPTQVGPNAEKGFPGTVPVALIQPYSSRFRSVWGLSPVHRVCRPTQLSFGLTSQAALK